MPKGLSRSELAEIGRPNTLGLQWRGPIELYGMFVELAQTAFSSTGFSTRKWSPDEKASDIYIVPDYIWDDVVVEKRPAIYVSLGDINCNQYPSSFGDQNSMGINMTGVHGTEHYYADVKSGTVTWNVLAETRGEALDIIGELARYICVFQPIIREDLCLKSFNLSQISPLSIVKEARERLQGSVTASFSYENVWTLVEEGPKVRIDVDVRQSPEFIAAGTPRFGVTVTQNLEGKKDDRDM